MRTFLQLFASHQSLLPSSGSRDQKVLHAVSGAFRPLSKRTPKYVVGFYGRRISPNQANAGGAREGRCNESSVLRSNGSSQTRVLVATTAAAMSATTASNTKLVLTRHKPQSSVPGIRS